MITGALYALTALHNAYGLMNVVNGAPVNLLNCVALLGSVVLFVAAVLTASRPRIAAKVGLAGSFLLWVFYSTMIVLWFSMPFSALQEIRSFISYREYVPLTGTLLGPVLLIVCTVTELRIIKTSAQ